MKIKKGDTVAILSGEDKGKKGKVLQVLPTENKILVEGVNVRTKHVKTRRADQPGGIMKQSVAIVSSKANVVFPKCGKVTRVAHKILDDGSKIRVCKKCEENLDKK